MKRGWLQDGYTYREAARLGWQTECGEGRGRARLKNTSGPVARRADWP